MLASARPISILVHWEWPFYFRLDGAEWNENITFFVSYCILLIHRINEIRY